MSVLMINELHRNSRITFREWLRYLREWMENIAEHHSSAADVERLKNTPKPSS